MKEGDVVGVRFVVERLLAEGGMSSVFVARDSLEDRLVALKIFPPAGDDQRARFEREAELLAGLEHPGIVRYVAHGAPPEGPLYLAMEHLEGEDLATRLERGPLSVEDTLVIVERVADALASAHDRGIVHRDIKPANLFLVRGSVADPRILDFGIARVEATSTLTRAGFTLGTPDYMAPEQARGDEVLTPAIDVFSLGCVAFECLVGRPPFVADHPLAVLTRILLEDAPRVERLRADAPEPVGDLVQRLLAKATEERPGTARDVGPLVASTRASLARAPAQEPTSEPARSLTARAQQLLCLSFVDRGVEEGDGPRAASVRALVSRFGGRTELLVDGTMLVLFPGTGSATAQAERSARCALALRAELSGSHVVLVSGRAEMSRALPVGEIIDRGVTLLAAARDATRLDAPSLPGIPIDAVTADLVGAAFALDARGAAMFLVGERNAAAERTLLGRHQACVGRERELSTLEAAYDDVLDRGAARAVLVTGARGIGKSRLRAELSRSLASKTPDALFLSARGDPARHGEPFGLVSQALRSAFHLRENEPLASRHEKIRRHAHAAISPQGEAIAGAEQVAELLGELLGAPFPDDESPLLRAARADPIRMGDQMWRAWHAFLEATSRTRPVVVVLDDLDAADLPSVTFFDAELRNLAARPLFVVAFAGPDLDARWPTLWAGRELTRLSLGPLSEEASAAMVRAALGNASPDLSRRIVERAEGNPFFVEEIVRAVSQGRGDALPATILSMVEARLDALPPEARRALRAASVFGRLSWRSGIAALCGGLDVSLDEALAALVRTEILVPRGVVTLEGELEYAFRNAMVRDAAYATLTDEDRTLGHDLAGRWLAERRPREAVAIAEHFSRGAQPRAAMAWFERSAELALEGNDFASAAARAARAIACGAEGAALGRLELLSSECRRHAGANVEMLEHAERAREILVGGSEGWFRAMANVVLGAIRLGRKDVLEPCLSELGREVARKGEAPFPPAAARIAHYLHFAGHHDFATRLLSAAWSGGDRVPERGDVGPLSRAAWFHRACATRALVLGDLASYLDHLERAIEAFERAGDVREPTSERVNAGFARMELGLYEEAEVVLRQSLVDADALGLTHTAATARENLGAVLMRRGRLDEGRDLLRRAIACFEGQKNRRMEGNARAYLGELHLRAGDPSAAEGELRRSVELLATVKPLLPMALATLSLAMLAAGRFDESLEIAERAAAALRDVGHPDEGEALVHLAGLEARIALGRVDEARGLAAAARDRLIERAGRINVPAWRGAFLAVEENARTLAIADDLGAPASPRA